MHKDAFGTEIKVGNIIAVARYVGRAVVNSGIVNRISETPKMYWVHFTNEYGREERAQLSKGKNYNIIIADPRRVDGGILSKAKTELIKAGTLPADYQLGDSVDPANVSTKVVSSKKPIEVGEAKLVVSEGLLDSLGPPSSI